MKGNGQQRTETEKKTERNRYNLTETDQTNINGKKQTETVKNGQKQT